MSDDEEDEVFAFPFRRIASEYSGSSEYLVGPYRVEVGWDARGGQMQTCWRAEHFLADGEGELIESNPLTPPGSICEAQLQAFDAVLALMTAHERAAVLRRLEGDG